MELFKLPMDFPELLQKGFGSLQLGQVQEHHFDLLLAADQNTAFIGARLVGHQASLLKSFRYQKAS
tara:strand:+ start:382 stop:579 length:198 start_codon:yes stop_codon:yes gene_type:complete